MAYVYLIGTSVYALIWTIFFVIRKDLRKKMFFTSIFSAPLGISELLFIPEYWIPQFQTIPIFKELFLESILFCFFLGGVVSVIYQVLFKEKLFETNTINPYLTLIAPILFLTYFLKIFNINLVYYVFISMFIGSFFVLYYLGKKSKKIIYSAIINTILYAILYFVPWYSFPELPASYQFENLSRIILGGIPLEEFLWIFSFHRDLWKGFCPSSSPSFSFFPLRFRSLIPIFICPARIILSVRTCGEDRIFGSCFICFNLAVQKV